MTTQRFIYTMRIDDFDDSFREFIGKFINADEAYEWAEKHFPQAKRVDVDLTDNRLNWEILEICTW